jgi:hypothetical protein
MHDRSISRREALALALAAAGTLVRPAGRAELLFATDQSGAQRVPPEELRLLVRNALGRDRRLPSRSAAPTGADRCALTLRPRSRRRFSERYLRRVVEPLMSTARSIQIQEKDQAALVAYLAQHFGPVGACGSSGDRFDQTL